MGQKRSTTKEQGLFQPNEVDLLKRLVTNEHAKRLAALVEARTDFAARPDIARKLAEEIANLDVLLAKLNGL